MATSNQQPATSNQQPATSNQQPATSNQQPATSNQLTAKFNPDYWYFKHQPQERVEQLLTETATIVGYLPSSGTVFFELQKDSAGYQVWNVTRSYLQASITGSNGCELLITKEEVEAWYKPVSDVEDLNPDDFHSNEHDWDTFGRSEVESFMRWLMIENQKAGKFEPVKCSHAHDDLCQDGLLTDFGDFRYLITRKALRLLAGRGFYKPL